MEDTVIQVAGTVHWAPLLAAAACSVGIALLLLATWRAEKQHGVQQQRILSLETQLAESVRGQLGLAQLVAELKDQGSALRLRQDRLEKRAPDARRIDHAVRLVQHGHAEAGMLRELGLSHGEAQLLLRLHKSEPQAAVRAAPPPGKSQADGLAQAEDCRQRLTRLSAAAVGALALFAALLDFALQ